MAAISLRNLSDLTKAASSGYARHGQRLPTWAAALLVLLIGSQLAHLVWALIPTPHAGSWKPVPVVSQETHAEPLNLASIDDAGLFGKFQAPVNPTAAAAESAPDTELALTLLGILADKHSPNSSRALIGAANGDEKPYSIGDDISRGVTLKAIFADRVVLSRAGRLETLRLDKDQPSNAEAPAVGESGNENVGADVQQLADIRSKMLSDPSKAQDYIRVQPARLPGGNGQLGYRIYPGKNRALFTAAGLRPGDIVTQVNGVPLSDPAKSLQLLSDLSQAQQLSVVIERGGQSQTVNLSLN